MTLSPASVRNVMADLEQLGLRLRAAHLGRAAADRARAALLRRRADAGRRRHRATTAQAIEAQVAAAGTQVGGRGADRGLRHAVRADARAPAWCWRRNQNTRLKHIEFVRLEPERALVVLVAEDGQVENRIVDLPPGLPTSALTEATNFLNARIRGRTLAEARSRARSRARGRPGRARPADPAACRRPGSRAGRAATTRSAS